MVFLPLKPLDVDSALALVTQPIEKIRVHWKNHSDDPWYLVDSCSGHPRLLQAACHSLLTILESKKQEKDVIERSDVDRALTSDDFRELCMRFYRNPTEEKVERKKPIMHLLSRIRAMDKEKIRHDKTPKGTHYWNDLHRITILSAISMLFEQNKATFTIRDIQGELKNRKVDILPNVMRTILDHLCLSSIFHLKDESALLTKKDADLQKKIDQSIMPKEKIGKPDFYLSDDPTFPKFTYEFGVKIFPKLLVAHFGGIDQCNEELQKLIEKKDWAQWLRR